jgi:SNF2 family DNA or RNA helicase
MAEHAILPMMRHDEFDYRDYQIAGIRWMANRGSCILGDQPGLGKTLQCLTLAAIDFNRGDANRALVVAPPGLLANWQEEIAKFTNFSCQILHGSPKKRTKILDSFDKDFLLVGYEQVKPHLEDLNSMGFDIVFVDEVQNVKNPKAQRTKALLKLSGYKRIVPITGSPMLNQAEDLWVLLHLVRPEQWPSYWAFYNRYVVTQTRVVEHHGQTRSVRSSVGVKNESELHTKLSDVMLRRLKADAMAELKEPLLVRVWVDLTELQRKLYREVKEESKLTIPGNPTPLETENALLKFLKLKEIVGSAGTVDGHVDESSKLDVMIERIDELIKSGESVVVFTQFRKILSFIENRLKALDIPIWSLHGGVPKLDRVPMVNEWAESTKQGKPGVMACMFQVGGVGLNMTACNTVMLPDRLYVPELNRQAVDRVHRMGVDTTKPVQIVEFMARKTIDQRLDQILDRKSEIFGAVVDGVDWKRRAIASILAEDGDDEDE